MAELKMKFHKRRADDVFNASSPGNEDDGNLPSSLSLRNQIPSGNSGRAAPFVELEWDCKAFINRVALFEHVGIALSKNKK